MHTAGNFKIPQAAGVKLLSCDLWSSAAIGKGSRGMYQQNNISCKCDRNVLGSRDAFQIRRAKDVTPLTKLKIVSRGRRALRQGWREKHSLSTTQRRPSDICWVYAITCREVQRGQRRATGPRYQQSSVTTDSPVDQRPALHVSPATSRPVQRARARM